MLALAVLRSIVVATCGDFSGREALLFCLTFSWGGRPWVGRVLRATVYRGTWLTLWEGFLERLGLHSGLWEGGAGGFSGVWW